MIQEEHMFYTTERSREMKKIFQERVVGICDTMAREEWSIEINRKIVLVRKEMCEASQEKVPGFVNEYDDLLTELHCKSADRIYLQGFRDALDLMKT